MTRREKTLLAVFLLLVITAGTAVNLGSYFTVREEWSGLRIRSTSILRQMRQMMFEIQELGSLLRKENDLPEEHTLLSDPLLIGEAYRAVVERHGVQLLRYAIRGGEEGVVVFSVRGSPSSVLSMLREVEEVPVLLESFTCTANGGMLECTMEVRYGGKDL
ncbi:hypothetical protein Spith_1573 [Spirochaeta thermophila DSM 6578]|uniref:Uncharacterized protein n=1 Tax=Winmispira thermophila (strain ATCC 700085 / DSM 6578 / Z-1203) TaxID=869211 RepID=G0GAT8_WINT7|nr:hypothetical protein [Spirochaeta thermophila]AEJ61834.1 hypothetical protein Spith_1573 [Spirochaeta thermophila DSM 6578]